MAGGDGHCDAGCALSSANVNQIKGSVQNGELLGVQTRGEISPTLARQLHGEIMADVEAVFQQRADSLWRRGQAEVSRLQQERDQVVVTLKELQARQDMLVAEHNDMKRALVDITTKLEFVATEMREALRQAPQRASSGQADGIPAPGSPAGCGESSSWSKADPVAQPHSPPRESGSHAAAAAAAAIAAAALGAAALSATNDPGRSTAGPSTSESSTALPDGPSTPRRATSCKAAASAPPLSVEGTPCFSMPNVAPGSPAVLLSLASALPSDVTPPPQTAPPAPPTASKRIHIADCVGPAPMSPDRSGPPFCMGFPSAPPSPADVVSGAYAGLAVVNHLLDSPVLSDPGNSLFGPMPGVERSMRPLEPQLRAEAPVFVPGLGTGPAPGLHETSNEVPHLQQV